MGVWLRGPGMLCDEAPSTAHLNIARVGTALWAVPNVRTTGLCQLDAAQHGPQGRGYTL